MSVVACFCFSIAAICGFTLNLFVYLACEFLITRSGKNGIVIKLSVKAQ